MPLAPDESAARVLSPRQRVALAASALALAAGLVTAPLTTVTAVALLLLCFSGCSSAHRLRICLRGIHGPGARSSSDARANDPLPSYSILVPLYREASVVPGLVEAIERLDYPAERIDVQLLLEEDDDETAEAVRRLAPPKQLELVVVPAGSPRTKPRALDHGLARARGELLVVYDAEDRPEPDQLLKAVAAFRSASAETVCFQARLQFWNRNQNVLTRLFVLDFAHKFDLFLPGLEDAGAPVPLGGTSNHFKTRALRDIGGWDPYNVTEDLELGIRLARTRRTAGVIDSVTWEEATSGLRSWVRQRSRWQKGHLQTWLVLMRRPLRLWRELGPRGWLHAQALTLGVFLPPLVEPVFTSLALLWLLDQAGVAAAPLLPGWLYVAVAAMVALGQLAFIAVYALGAVKAGYRSLLPYALLLPGYALVVAVATWRGLLQLMTRASYWDKTPHGLAGAGGSPPQPHPAEPQAPAPSGLR